MSERKNIDRLFQEKFKDFEAIPPQDAWANIEAKLDNKKKRRVIPFWWRLSGVAAVFLIGFLISKSIYDDNGIQTENAVVNESNSNSKERSGIEDVHIKNVKENIIPTENPVAGETKSTESDLDNVGSIKKNNGPSSKENAVAASDDKRKSTISPEDEKESLKTIISSKSAVAEKPSRHRSLKNRANSVKNKASITESDSEKQQNQLAQNEKSNNGKLNLNSPNGPNNRSIGEKSPIQIQNPKQNNPENQAVADKKNISLDALKGTSDSKIATKETEKKVNDTAAMKGVATNELEELLNEKESKQKKEPKISRWQLASNVAPVFLGSASNGSPVDPSLAKNSKSYNTDFGYGIGVGYALNKRITVRTGLNKVNLSYDTNDISFFRGIQAKTLAGVQPAASGTMIHVESNNINSNPVLSPENELLPFESSIVHKTSGYLQQEMGYLEMPVEMTYNILDKRFGIKLIGGFSTLFLQDNSIRVISGEINTLLGEANNLNDVHFSTNFGVGLKYSFLKSFEFNVEPTLKYQLNTFNANAGSFKPYLFGVYSGISYKF